MTGAVDRIVTRLLAEDIPLEKQVLQAAARRVAAEEAPLESDEVVVAAVDAILGLGPLERLLRDPLVTDVLVNGPSQVWVERAGSMSLTAVHFPDDAAVVASVERVLAPLGLRIDRASPTVDARLSDGSRLHAVIPPVAVDGPVVAVRRFTKAVQSLAELVASGSAPVEVADLLREAVLGRKNLVISGGTGAGKTTLLNVLSTEIPASQRIVTVEDAAELELAGHVVRLEARPPNAEGAGEISLQQLVRSALRLRPDRIIVGEVRGPEALDMIWALNTGHDGSMSTVHANSPAEALWRLETLAMSGERRVGEAAVRRQMMSAIDVVVQVARVAGERRVVEVSDVGDDGVETRWLSSSY
ncbi:MAG: CpaF family protein [Acidimicrobiia bacterium]|nr:CpaF family protein [Acidimicrobiia bacterium]